jgi:ActR/RegA family two-component response regulator
MDQKKQMLIISNSAEFAQRVIGQNTNETFDVTSMFSYSDGLAMAQSGEFEVIVIEDLLENQKLPELIQRLDSTKFEKCIVVSAEPARYNAVTNDQISILDVKNKHAVLSVAASLT